jgi:hypothetical protein
MKSSNTVPQYACSKKVFCTLGTTTGWCEIFVFAKTKKKHTWVVGVRFQKCSTGLG